MSRTWQGTTHRAESTATRAKAPRARTAALTRHERVAHTPGLSRGPRHIRAPRSREPKPRRAGATLRRGHAVQGRARRGRGRAALGRGTGPGWGAAPGGGTRRGGGSRAGARGPHWAGERAAPRGVGAGPCQGRPRWACRAETGPGG
jgi:hypothetical protein